MLMSNGNIFLGTARGKLGDIVLARRKGKQIQRTKVTPSNPKSEAQCRQRMCFASLTVAAQRLDTIVNHSFEGITYGADSRNHFIKINMPMARAAANWDGQTEIDYNDFLIKGAKTLPLLNFKVSEGSLYFPAYSFVNGQTYLGVQYKQNKSVTFPTVAITSQQDYENVLATIGVKPGQQLTIIAVVTDNNTIADFPPTGAYNVQRHVEFARVVFLNEWPGASEPLVARKLNPAFYNVERSKDWIGNVDIALEPSGTDVDVTLAVPDTLTPAAAALILSDRSTTQWRRSTAFLVSDYDFTADADAVWQSYSEQAAELVSDYYLNQADNSTTSGGKKILLADVLECNVVEPGVRINGTSNAKGAALLVKATVNLSSSSTQTEHLEGTANAVVESNGTWTAGIKPLYDSPDVLSFTVDVYYNGRRVASKTLPRS